MRTVSHMCAGNSVQFGQDCSKLGEKVLMTLGSGFLNLKWP